MADVRRSPVCLVPVEDLETGTLLAYRNTRGYSLLRVERVVKNTLAQTVFKVFVEGEPEHPRTFRDGELALVASADPRQAETAAEFAGRRMAEMRDDRLRPEIACVRSDPHGPHDWLGGYCPGWGA